MGFNSAFKGLKTLFLVSGYKMNARGTTSLALLKDDILNDWGTLLVVQLVEALRYKSEGRRFDSPMVSLEFFIDVILPLGRFGQ